MSGRLGPALTSSVVEQLLGAQLAGSVVLIIASLWLSERVVSRRAWNARCCMY